MYVGMFQLDATVRFLHQSRNASNVPTDATGLPTFRVYELPSETPLSSGNASIFDDDDTTGTYLISFSATSGAGFERGGNYACRVANTTTGVAYAELYEFTIL